MSEAGHVQVTLNLLGIIDSDDPARWVTEMHLYMILRVLLVSNTKNRPFRGG